MERNQTRDSTVSRCRGHLPHTGETSSDYQEPTFQSSEVTSLLLGTSCPPSRIQWRSTSWVELELLFSFRFQIRAVESPELKDYPNTNTSAPDLTKSYIFRKNGRSLVTLAYDSSDANGDPGTHPEASRSLTGFQAHMKTSDSWPRSTVALLAGISTSTSISMGSPWLSEQSEANARVQARQTNLLPSTP